MRVTIVIDERFGEHGDIPPGEAFWLIESPANRTLAERLWAEGGRDPNSAVFKWTPQDDATETLLGILNSVKLHHPEMSEAVVIGYAPTPAFEAYLSPLKMMFEGGRVVIRTSP